MGVLVLEIEARIKLHNLTLTPAIGLNTYNYTGVLLFSFWQETTERETLPSGL